MSAFDLERELTEHDDMLRRHHETLALRMIEKAAGMPSDTLKISAEDRLRGAITEALFYLDKNSPPAAHRVLRRALKL